MQLKPAVVLTGLHHPGKIEDGEHVRLNIFPALWDNEENPH